MPIQAGWLRARGKTRLRHAWRVVLLSVLVLASATLSRTYGADQPYIVGIGDILEIQVWDNKDLNQTVFVRPDGKVSLPLVGEIQAAGKTVLQLQSLLNDAYSKTVKSASVTVIVKEIKSRPVYFIGGFVKPGVEQLTRDMTLLSAISTVGGLLPTADGENGFILREGKRIPVDFTRLIQKGDVSQNIPLQVGDSVVAPVADLVYIHGEVKTPGAIKSTSDLTVLRAISQVGGVTPLGAKGRVEILRGQGEKKERIVVDVDKMMGSPNDHPDVRLKPGDIIFVPQRLF
jgi:polysaccharide export outer membrane protein